MFAFLQLDVYSAEGGYDLWKTALRRSQVVMLSEQTPAAVNGVRATSIWSKWRSMVALEPHIQAPAQPPAPVQVPSVLHSILTQVSPVKTWDHSTISSSYLQRTL